MYVEYLLAETLTVAVAGTLLLGLIRKFSSKAPLKAVVLFPLLSFVIGFSLRLSGPEEIIDLGFFFTDFSFLFVYILFTIALLLGQLRYWERV